MAECDSRECSDRCWDGSVRNTVSVSKRSDKPEASDEGAASVVNGIGNYGGAGGSSSAAEYTVCM